MLGAVRIVFLDFDGVLNARAFVERAGSSTSPTSPASPALELLDPGAVARVEALCVVTGASIVVSSSWRASLAVDALERMLRAKGLRTAQVLGATPFIPHKRGRGQEIQRWLDEAHGVPDGIVILDDEPSMLHLTPWLVETSFETGLTDADVEAAVRVIGRPPPPVPFA